MMGKRRRVWLLVAALVACVVWSRAYSAEKPEPAAPVSAETREEGFPAPRSIEEARARAKLVFEMANGSLQVVHRDYFDEENILAIPSASLEDVFIEMQREFGLEMKWLNTGTDVLNSDHMPADEFEGRAGEAIAKGESSVEELREGSYRFAGAVRLKSQCLKCHVKRRNTNEDRFAGLVIVMPMSVAE